MMTMFKILALVLFSLNMKCAGQTPETADNSLAATQEMVFIASTPGDPAVKAMLGIPEATLCDFIRWDLTLSREGESGGAFELKLLYGEAAQGTPGFKGGGEPGELTGKWTTDLAQGYEVYRLTAGKTGTTLSLLKINGNLFHLLTSDHRLMVGNGGWSYTLNRKTPVTEPDATFPIPPDLSFLKGDDAAEVTFDGRTPCPGITILNDIQAGYDCYKLKWRLILYRNPATGAPTTYKLITIKHRAIPFEGTWKLEKDQNNALICRLTPSQAGASISFVVGDENVLFFLDKEDRMLTGNEDFSYTLNRKQD